MYRGIPDMTAPNQSNRDRYDLDAKSTHEIDMIETLEQEFAVIWLRGPAYRWHQLRRLDPNLHRYDWGRFSILHTWDCDTLKNNVKKNLERLSHICVSFGQGRLSHISVNG